jgi:hypothetical protein
MTRTYRQEDVQQILQIAIARQGETEELSRTQLLEIADEMGIAVADLELAEQEWLAQCGESQERQAFDRARRHRFQQYLTRYLIVNAFLVLLNFLTGGGLSWSIYVVLGWGLPLSLNAWKTYQTTGEDYENAFQGWCRQRRLKKTVHTFLNRFIGV